MNIDQSIWLCERLSFTPEHILTLSVHTLIQSNIFWRNESWLILGLFHFLSVGYNRVSFGMPFNINIHLYFNTWAFMFNLPVESHLIEPVTVFKKMFFEAWVIDI